MLATLIVVFREVMEAGLIIGIVLAATRGVTHRGLWVSYGIIGGVLGACIVALFTDSISEMMHGFGQELFNVCILVAAVLMLIWHNVWMARHGREIALEMREIGEEVAHGKRSLLALAIVVGVAVLREGAEVVLFLYGIAISGNDSTSAMAAGGALGLISGVVMGSVTYLGLLRIPSRHLFKVTSWLLALLAAGMAAQAAALLQQADVIGVMADTVWDSSSLISDAGLTGKALHTLIGYTAQPSQLQLMVYVAVLVVTFTLMRLLGHTPHPHKHAPKAA